jgi:hypothetical protein
MPVAPGASEPHLAVAQERGVLRSSYEEGMTPRDRLGPGSARAASSRAAARKEPVNA